VVEANSEAGSRTSSPKRPRHVERSAESEITLAKAESPKRARRQDSEIAREIERASRDQVKRSVHTPRRNSSEENLPGPVLNKCASKDSKLENSGGYPTEWHNPTKPRSSKPAHSGGYPTKPVSSNPANWDKPGSRRTNTAAKRTSLASIPAMPKVSFGTPRHPADEEPASVEDSKANNGPPGSHPSRRCPLQAYIDQIECDSPPPLMGHHQQQVDELSNSWNRLKHGLSHSLLRKDPDAIKYWRDAKTKKRLTKRISGISPPRKGQNKSSEDDGDSENGKLVEGFS